jgi:hypothetical protein
VAGGCASAFGRRADTRGGDRGLGYCKGEKIRGLICIEAVGRNRVHRVVVIPGSREGVSAKRLGARGLPRFGPLSVRGPRCLGPPSVLGSRVRARPARG